MTDPSTFRDQSQSRGDGMGLLTVVGLILTGTFWTVGSFLESSPPVEAAALHVMPVSSPVAVECEAREASDAGAACDTVALTSAPAWRADRSTPESLLRTTPVRAVLAARRAGGAVSYAPCAGAPVPHDVNG